MKQFFGRKSRSALAMVLIVSLGLHVVAIVIFGTIKFVSEALREETVFEAVESNVKRIYSSAPLPDNLS